MGRVSASVVLDVPGSLCFAACRDRFEDSRWVAAYAALRRGRTYSGRVAESEPGRRLVIDEAAILSRSGLRSHALGWRVTFEFRDEAGGGTRAEVTVEYGAATAFVAMGTARFQAEQAVLERVAMLVALERGVRAGGASGGAGWRHSGCGRSGTAGVGIPEVTR